MIYQIRQFRWPWVTFNVFPTGSLSNVIFTHHSICCHRVSVRPSDVGDVAKRLNAGSCKHRYTIANDSILLMQKISTKVRKCRCDSGKLRYSTGQQVSDSDVLSTKICVHQPRSRPRRCAGGGIHGVVTTLVVIESVGPVDISIVGGIGMCWWHPRHRMLDMW